MGKSASKREREKPKDNQDKLHAQKVQEIIEKPEIVGETRKGLEYAGRMLMPYNPTRREYTKSPDVILVYSPDRPGSRQYCVLIEFKVGNGTNRDKAIRQLEAGAEFVDEKWRERGLPIFVLRAKYVHLDNQGGFLYEDFTREEISASYSKLSEPEEKNRPKRRKRRG